MCSDNAEVIDGARTILIDAHVRTVTEIARSDGRPLHAWSDADLATVAQVQQRALIDLFALAAAADLYRTVGSQLRLSGFSRLAGELCEDRTLLASLLGKATSSISMVPGRVHHVIPWKTKAFLVPRRWRKKLWRLGRMAAEVFGLR